jgi:hypothetical protein
MQGYQIDNKECELQEIREFYISIEVKSWILRGGNYEI